MTTPDAATILAGIKERQALASDASLGFSRMEERHAALIKVAYEDTPLLVAAVQAVLAQHQPGRVAIIGVVCKRHEAHRHFSIDAREAADVRACPNCSAMVYSSCTGCATGVSVDACPVRNVITRKLSGEDSSDGE